MASSAPTKKSAVTRQPNGSDALVIRERYFRQRRRLSDRGWIPVWITVAAVLGWLFIVGFSGLGR